MNWAVFVINSLQNGGAEKVVATQANYLQSQGIQVMLIFLRKWVQYELHPDIKIIYLTRKKHFRAYSYILEPVFLVRRLNRILDSVYEKGNVVLLTSHLLFPNFITRLSRYSGKAVYVLHARQDIVPQSDSLFYRMMIKWLYGRQKIICISSAVQEEMCRKYKIENQHMKIIHNPLDFQSIDRKVDQPLEFEEPFILYCGRLSRVKRPDRIINAFYKGNFYKSYRLVILGVGELRERLQKMTVEYGISTRVYFAGWETNVYRWLARAKLLVLTSETEGLSMVIMEALYCGCPVVSVKCHGPAEIMKGELAQYLCEPEDETIAETMKRALREYPSDLRKYTSGFAVENNIASYFNAYREWNLGS